MKPYKLKREVPPGGYMQFWVDKKPPTIIVTKFPRPRLPLRLVTNVNPPGEFVERVHTFV